MLSGSWFELVCPALSTALAFVPQSNELWRPWLQLECLIATEKRDGELVNGEKARTDHVSLSKGQDGADYRLDIL